MPRLLLATHNQGKVREYRLLLQGLPFQLVTLGDLGIQEVMAEEGSTFEENARAKAEGYGALSGLLTLGEDSGLEVEALGGEPGVRSARYAGDHASDTELVLYLLARMDGVPRDRRGARFRCAIALSGPGRETELFSGECPGIIGDGPQGEGGFGYDPVFYLPELGKTMAQLTKEAKNQVSHRARAARQACHRLEQMCLEVSRR
ncbi:MAG: RdgB/HAM1 family non-canonical purine NTP pyrophosphatase [Dehalococcoidia bacterium]